MQLKMQVQSERLVLMLAFMIDLHEVLKGVSECFPSRQDDSRRHRSERGMNSPSKT